MKLNIQLFATENEIIIPVKLDTTEVEEGLEDLKNTDVDDTFSNLSSITETLGQKLKVAGLRMMGMSRSIANILVSLGTIGVILGAIVGLIMLIVEAFKITAEENDEIAIKIETIRQALSNMFRTVASLMVNTLGKILNWLLDRILSLITLIGGVIKALTGKNIFSGMTTDFKKTEKSAKGIKSATASIKKNLYGWDEMTRVNESSGGGGGFFGGMADDLDDLTDKLNDFFRKMEEEVNQKAGAIRRWWFGGYDNFEDMWKNKGTIIKNWARDFAGGFEYAYNTFIKPVVDKIKNEVIDPIVTQVKKELGPLYKWVKENAIDPIVSEVKKYFEPFAREVDSRVISPLKEKLNTFKNGLLQKFGPFLNKIIDWINQTFGVFGVNLKHIDVKLDETGDEIQTNITDKIIEAGKQATGLSKPTYEIKMNSTQISTTGNLVNTLKSNLSNITGKTWDIKTKISTAGTSLKNWYNDTLRTTLSKTFGMNLPKLARGGIINMPGRGVPLAYGGERGAEGVIPLTDSQQMELLGQAIGKYITVNANITNTMNGRIISRELQKIQQENSFSSNR